MTDTDWKYRDILDLLRIDECAFDEFVLALDSGDAFRVRTLLGSMFEKGTTDSSMVPVIPQYLNGIARAYQDAFEVDKNSVWASELWICRHLQRVPTDEQFVGFIKDITPELWRLFEGASNWDGATAILPEFTEGEPYDPSEDGLPFAPDDLRRVLRLAGREFQQDYQLTRLLAPDADGPRAGLHVYVNDSDLFAWGYSGSIPINPGELDDLERAYVDYRAAAGDTKHASALWCARNANIRPQGAYYSSFPRETWELFHACGPEREVEHGNPYAPGDYQK